MWFTKERKLARMQKIREAIQLNAGTVKKLATKGRVIINLRQPRTEHPENLMKVPYPVWEMWGHQPESANFGGTRTTPTVFD